MSERTPIHRTIDDLAPRLYVLTGVPCGEEVAA